MTRTEAFELAERKAKHSDYDWLVWRNRDGTFSAERSSCGSIKKALLSVGTQGHFNLIQQRTGYSRVMRWRTGISAIQHIRYYQKNIDSFALARSMSRQFDSGERGASSKR